MSDYMTFGATERVILKSALDRWGLDAQIDQCIEECAELIHELVKFKRGRENGVKEELADVSIMVKQLAISFGEADVELIKVSKLARLSDRVDDYDREIVG